MPSIHFTITAEDKNLQKVLADIEKGVQGTSEQVEKSGLDIDSILSRIAKSAAAVGVAFSAQQLVRKIADVRGEFQQLEVAFNTILGSEEKAAALMSQLTKTAAITPFGLQEVAGSAKQLLAYGVAAEDVNDSLVMLGDIAAGLSIPLSDLAYLYGTTMTQGRMYTQDLNQFMGRGIPIAEELAKQFGVTKDKVKDLVTSGKIGFEQMHKSLVAMTSEGGKFGGLMEAQSKTIKGQISNLEDAIDVMFNEIGKTQEGVFNTALSGASKLVENYEEVGKILIGIVSTYGAYKGALIAFTAIQKVENAIVQEAAVQKSLAAMAGKTLSDTQARGAAVAQLYSAAQSKVASSLKAVSTATWANPYALITAAVVGLVAGVVILSKKIDENTGAFNRVKKAGEDYAGFLKTWEQKANGLISTIQNENVTNADRVRAYEELKKVMPGIVEQYTMEELALMGVANANKEVTKQVEIADKKGRAIQKKNLETIVKDYEDRIRSLQLIGRKDSANMLKNDPQYIQAKKELDELNKLEREIKKASQAVPTIKNKKYWEDIKKEAESALADMSVELKGTKEWLDLEKKIKQAESEIAKYSITKTGTDVKAANELAAKKAEYALELERYKQEMLSETESVEMAIRQAEINAMKDSTDKVLAQINIDYDKKIAENQRRKQEFIADVAEQKAAQWEIENPTLVEKGQKFDKTSVTEADLTPEQKAILSFYDLLAEKERNLAQAEASRDLLSNYQTYMQKRTEVAEKYEKDMAAMRNRDGSYKDGFSDENVSILRQQMQDALAAVDVEFAMKEEQFELWANSVATMSLKALEQLLEQAESELQAMQNQIEEGEGAGISYKELGQAQAKVSVLKQALKGKQLSPDKRAESDWKDLYDVLTNVSHQFDEIGKQVGGTAGEIISLAGNVAGGVISMINGVKAVSGAAAASMSALEKASVILAIVGAAMQVVTKIASMFGADYEAYNQAREAYQGYMDVLDDVINKQKELIETMTGDAAVEASRYALELIKKQIDATRQLGKERLNAGASAGSHSIGVRTSQSMGVEEWNQVADTLGYSVMSKLQSDKRLTGLFDLSVEQLEKLKEEAPLFWAKLDDDVREYLETLIKCEETAKDMKDALNESLTQVSFDSLYDEFIDCLMDMEMSAEDFSEKLSEMFMKSMLTDIINDKYKERLQTWYQRWADAMAGGASEQKLADLRKEYEKIIEDAMKERDQLASATGYEIGATSEQKATYGGFEAMSEETGSELNGRFTALQMAGEEIKNQMIASVVALNTLVISAGTGNSLLSDILTQHAITNAYLEDIVKYSKVAAGYGAKLDKIVEQTKNL